MRRLKHRLGRAMAICVVGAMSACLLRAVDSSALNANWDKVRKLRRGQEITVVMKGAKSYTGRFQSASDESLVVRLAAQDMTLARPDIMRISANGKVSRAFNVLGGAGIGAGVGAGIGQAFNNARPHESDIHGARTGSLVGVGIGAGIGALIHPLGGWHEVYRAQ